MDDANATEDLSKDGRIEAFQKFEDSCTIARKWWGVVADEREEECVAVRYDLEDRGMRLRGIVYADESN